MPRNSHGSDWIVTELKRPPRDHWYLVRRASLPHATIRAYFNSEGHWLQRAPGGSKSNAYRMTMMAETPEYWLKPPSKKR